MGHRTLDKSSKTTILVYVYNLSSLKKLCEYVKIFRKVWKIDIKEVNFEIIFNTVIK